jgi:P27 family predicted phage terminase small subunit
MPQKSATILKILNGSVDTDKARARDDQKVTPRGKPKRPGWAKLSKEEAEIFDYLMDEFVLPGVHGSPDGALMVELARTWVAYNKAMQKVSDFGMVMKQPESGKPVLQPYFRASQTLYDRMRRIMNDLGFTPVSRLRLAPPLTGRENGPSNWDEID